MTDFSISVDIATTPDRVWAVMIDIERWPEWTPSVRRIQRLDHGPLAVGSRARVWQPRLPPAVWQVSELLEGRSFTWVSSSPGVSVVATHGVEPTTKGARATLSLRFSGFLGPLIARLTRGLNQRYLALEAKGLSQRAADWPFEAPPNTAALTTRDILEAGAPILLVTHDADDGGWQFLPGRTVDSGDARVVGLGEMCSRDPSLRELADLPEGWRAWREGPGADWRRQPVG